MEIKSILLETDSLVLTLEKMNGWMFYLLEFNNVEKWLQNNYAIIHTMQIKRLLKINTILYLSNSTMKNHFMQLQEYYSLNLFRCSHSWVALSKIMEFKSFCNWCSKINFKMNPLSLSLVLLLLDSLYQVYQECT